jgi:transposase
MPRHRYQEFLRFLNKVEKATDPKLDLHFILDNYATHKHAKVKAWLEKHPRVHFHFVPTSASWLNLVELLFNEITRRQLKRLAVTGVDELITAITTYLERRNEDPKPIVWTASADKILRKVRRAQATLATSEARPRRTVVLGLAQAAGSYAKLLNKVAWTQLLQAGDGPWAFCVYPTPASCVVNNRRS